MGKKIWLDVPSAMERFAEIHGALRTAEGAFYIDEGDLSAELLEFIPPEPKSHKRTPTPLCPRCGSHMELAQIGKSKSYWQCYLFPKCYATRPLEDWGLIDGTLSINRKTLNHSGQVLPDQFLRAIKIPLTGKGVPVDNWFKAPCNALKGKSPRQALEDGEDSKIIVTIFITFAREWLKKTFK